MQILALDGAARAWSPNGCGWVFSAAGRWSAAPAAFGCASPRPGPGRQLTAAITRLQTYAPADQPEPPHDQEGQTQGPWNSPRPASSRATSTAKY